MATKTLDILFKNSNKWDSHEVEPEYYELIQEKVLASENFYQIAPNKLINLDHVERIEFED